VALAEGGDPKKMAEAVVRHQSMTCPVSRRCR
jgi:hypothetical protein